MAAIIRRGHYGGPRPIYGSFAGKSTAEAVGLDLSTPLFTIVDDMTSSVTVDSMVTTTVVDDMTHTVTVS